ncbi:hypothetical protein ACFOUP_17055 [Belliella kenyensis]|uniref:Uncharacterized protein n=1 Tax=Belliella kenyensis TaxID=1472724 RepID=A0ABV8EQV6_9BACT|nr:hypothetical protein [Belliella kenyensis]MCH7402841.1 hypothetical protein [Belliella kenyensis]MDN3602547.1 hypothetical protein [Belliella kenyensis]
MENPERALSEIRLMMERSSRFLSLSGVSGILAGIYALIGVGIFYFWLSPFSSNQQPISQGLIWKSLILAMVVLILAVATAGWMSQKKSRKESLKFWAPASRRFMQALFLPVISGGLFALALLHVGQYNLIPSATLIFYGLGLISAGHFTMNEIKHLGIYQLICGLFAAFFPEFGLVFWALGFGVLHIVYGGMMYYRYER